MARRSHKSTKRRKKMKKKRLGDLPNSCRAGVVAALTFLGTVFAFAALLHDDWVDWGDSSTMETSISLWSRCYKNIHNFRTCVELRNSPDDEALADAGLVALILLVFAVTLGVIGTYVTTVFAFGKPLGLLCFNRSRNAALSFFLTLLFSVFAAVAWVAYSSIYFSTDDYKDADPEKNAGASFFMAVVASALGGVAVLGALFNWWVDARLYEDTVYKKAVVASLLLTVALGLVSLSLGTRGWVRSSSSKGFEVNGFTGRAEVGLFKYCLVSGPMETCSLLHNSDADVVKANSTGVSLDTLGEGGTTTAVFLVIALAAGVPAAFLSLIHGLRKNVSCLCFARHRNGAVVFFLSIVFTVSNTIGWIAYSTIVYSDEDYKDSEDTKTLKAGFSLGFAIAASIVGALAILFSCLARHSSPDWYGSYYDGDDDDNSTIDDTTDDTYDDETTY